MRSDLRLIPFFADLSDDVILAIERYCRREHYSRGELVFAEGDFGDRMYIIQSGQVKVISERNGTERIFSYLNPGNFFGETALLTGEPRNASVRVVIDSRSRMVSAFDCTLSFSPAFFRVVEFRRGVESSFHDPQPAP